MNNAEKFKQIFGLYATELWSMPESDFLEWLNRDVETTQIDHTADIGKKVDGDCISRQAALDAIMGQPPEPHYPSWYAAQIEKLPAVQPDHVADSGKKVCVDTISRQAAIEAMKDMYRAAEKWLRDATDDVTKARAESCMASLVEIKLRTEKLPAVQPATNCSEIPNGSDDTISRQAAIDAVDVLCQEHRYRIPGKRETYSQYNEAWQDALDRAEAAIGNLPSAQPATNCSEIPNSSDDTISRQRALDMFGLSVEEARRDETD